MFSPKADNLEETVYLQYYIFKLSFTLILGFNIVFCSDLCGNVDYSGICSQ